MKKLAELIAGNWDIALLYILALAAILFLIYLLLVYANVLAVRRNAVYLKELLESTVWADMVKLIRNEEYVDAVLKGCKMILEDAR